MTQENLPVEVSKDSSEIFKVMDRLDDQIILAELENRIVQHWVYSFKQDGKLVENLSKAGVDACCTEMAKQGHVIEEDEVRYLQDPSDPEYFLFNVIARRIVMDNNGNRSIMDSVNGAKRQWTKVKGKPNPFWFEQGCMKACRNARIRLIPEEIKVRVLAAAREGGKIRPVTEEDMESTPQTHQETHQTHQAKEYADRARVEGWIAEYIGPNPEHKKFFKLWAASFNMVDKNNFGHHTLDKVNSVFVERLFANPDNAAANFASWFEIEKAKETVKEVFPEAEVVGGDHETTTS